MSYLTAVLFYCVLWCVFFVSCAVPSLAERASLVIDADTGAVLHAKNARLRSFPASLTKLMTVYLLFEAIEEGQITLKDKLRISAKAERQPPSKLGLRRGETISVRDVLLAIIVRSANDAAVVAAERLAGSESAFARMMNAKAKTLCMSDTVFRNASGLPDPQQATTARDLAILAQALHRQFPQHDHFFSVRSFRYAGKTFHTYNSFMTNYKGVHGLKTGFTNDAGYNLVTTAERDGRRLIGVILGERSRSRRKVRMAKLLDEAFAQDNTDQMPLTVDSLVDSVDQDPDVCIGEIDSASGWSLFIGVRKHKREARNLTWEAIREHRETLGRARPLLIPFLRGSLQYRACITGLQRENAIAACKRMRKRDKYCIVMSPKALRIKLSKGRIALERARRLIN